jgi:hypothetical protein
VLFTLRRPAIRPALAAALALLWACKTEVAAVDAAPLPSTSVNPRATPAASVACARDADCVAVHGPCCNFWPANAASRSQVKKSIEAADGERCQGRLCAMPLVEAKCDRGACIVHAVEPGPFGQ